MPGLFDGLEPAPVRGVIELRTCPVCGLHDPVYGLPGEGVPVEDLNGPFCHGHAIFAE